jgi:hypothetical protein
VGTPKDSFLKVTLSLFPWSKITCPHLFKSLFWKVFLKVIAKCFLYFEDLVFGVGCPFWVSHMLDGARELSGVTFIRTLIPCMRASSSWPNHFAKAFHPNTITLGIKISTCSQVPVAHTYNPSYSGGNHQEDWCLKPAQANSSRDPILKIPNTKRAGRVAQGEGPEFKPQYHTQKKFF